ncbi:hypothetical protein CcaverHIS002_0605840 [Cutaneotrichosporon cavernicola]|nr:hypothetical protein CcaverHIS002_0605840 [Cutaneotrichosporon cavernicola]
MSFPAALRPAARSAYRDVLRAARDTFHADPARHAQFPPAQPLEGPPVDFAAPEEIQKRVSEWKEVASFLRKNVVQGRQDETGTFKLRVTKDTDLGDNETIKAPKPMPVTPFPNRGKRRRKCGE